MLTYDDSPSLTSSRTRRKCRGVHLRLLRVLKLAYQLPPAADPHGLRRPDPVLRRLPRTDGHRG